MLSAKNIGDIDARCVSLVLMTMVCLVVLKPIQPVEAIEVDPKIPVDLVGEQKVKFLPIRVVNEAGEAVAGVRIKPWALQSSQGHGWWRDDPKERSKMAPQEVLSDGDGNAKIAYPYYRDLSEKTTVTSVSVSVDHKDYTFESLHIDVPLQEEKRHEVVLKQGASVVIEPLLDGKLAPTNGLYVISSGDRSWLTDSGRKITDQGFLQLSSLPAEKVAIRLVKIVDEQATHFGPLLVLDLKQGETIHRSVELKPVVTVSGQLSSDQKRTVQDGRVSFWSLRPSYDFPDCPWIGWAPVREDGKFTFSWPADESLQIIALCRDMIATPGTAPNVVQNPPNPDPYERPHVFSPKELSEEIMIPMRPLVACEVLAVDDADNPLEGIQIGSCPNVQWWNEGSQIYCSTLYSVERAIVTGDPESSVDREGAPEFRQTTDATGHATLMLPEGKESIYARSEEYELPISIGHREVEVKLKIGETTKLKLVMQPSGQEQLGEWEKLAGIVFGCSTREGKRICALPGVKAKVAAFRDLLDEAEDPRDPKILAEAYSYIVEVLQEAGDAKEAAKWQRKVAQQQALIGIER